MPSTTSSPAFSATPCLPRLLRLRRRKPGFWLRTMLPLMAVFGLQGCGVLPARAKLQDETAAPVTASSLQAISAKLDLRGAKGRLTPQARRKVLAGLAAEGKADLSARHLSAMAALAEDNPTSLYAGNEVQLLVDGPATFAAMFADLETARESILLETYIIEDRSIAQRLAALLVRKQAQGVHTMVMYDALGSMGTNSEYFDTLKAGGVTVCAFNPVNPFAGASRWKPTQRDHRKILVVDGKVAFTGGINISEVYSSGSFGRRHARAKAAQDLKDGWRDTQIRVRGPVVAAFEALVREAWVSQGCGQDWPSSKAQTVSTPAAVGNKVVQVLPSGSDGDESRIYSSLLLAIDASMRSAHITMAYFAPGQDMIDALCEAAKRGVDVVLILPSVSDFSPALHAGRSHYQALLEAGVKVHELQGSVLHAKTAVIDGVYSTVGSSNMDWRSFAGNNEVNAVVIGDDFGQDMEAMFRRDLAASQAITLEQWQQRPLWQRAKEWSAGLFERWW